MADGIGAVTGSVPDVVSMALGVSEAMAPDKGFAYNLCIFHINLRDEGQAQQSVARPASAATPASGSKAASPAPPEQRSSAASAPQTPGSDVGLKVRSGPIIFVVRSGAVGETDGIQDTLEVGIRELAARDRITGVVELRKLEGFDTGIFDTLAIEVAVQEQEIVPRGVLLVIKGLINPAGFGYAHFVGAVLIRAVEHAGTPQLRSEAQFITQAPPRLRGAGIFGQAIETHAFGSSLTVRMQRAPLFER